MLQKGRLDNDLTDHRVIRQHGENHLRLKSVGCVVEQRHSRHGVRCNGGAVPGPYVVAGLDKVAGDGCAHAAKADES